MRDLPEMKVEVRSLSENPPQASVMKQGSTVRGFITGIACSASLPAQRLSGAGSFFDIWRVANMGSLLF